MTDAASKPGADHFQPLGELARTIADAVPSIDRDAAGWRETDLEAAIARAVGADLRAPDGPVVVTGRRRLKLAGWRLGDVDLVETRGDEVRWIEVKWATSAREVWWLAWDVLKLAAARYDAQHAGIPDRPAPTAALIVAAIPAEGDDELARARAALHAVLEPPASWTDHGLVGGLVAPALEYWLLCAHENRNTYPRRVPDRFRLRGAAPVEVVPRAAKKPWRLHVVEVDVPPAASLVAMPGSAAHPIAHTIEGTPLGSTALPQPPDLV